MKITGIRIFKTPLPYVDGTYTWGVGNQITTAQASVVVVDTDVGRLERLMDHVVQGHGYAKAPFDAAFWDILGQSCDQPVWTLMGGKLTDGAPMYRVARATRDLDFILEQPCKTYEECQQIRRVASYGEAA